ncbi:MAG TPA: chemotaxis protein CheD [Candidatus Hydrogenedentes bacterium]|nr:chemotaxis protein CheD [Candidatus Hydrogenedentota bacterium]HPG67205.1 chemotaxis protein CheD [Candidatus Hydrogenedentota bacterium]
MKLTSPIDYYLEPGYIFFSKVAATARTVVGSCVVVCLWDKSLKYGAMGHYLFPMTRDPKEATARYGNVAIPELVRLMEEAGCTRTSLVAQILGGARPADSATCDIAEQNVALARDLLARKAIKVLSEDVGGTMGRKLVFNTGTGEVAVLKVHRLRRSDWMP